MTTFTNNTSLVEALYVGYFGRAGDPVGMNYWVGQLNSGAISISNLAASFSTQTEARTKYPYLAAPNIANPTEFINQVYQNLFNRAPDAAGLAYWSAQLTAAGGNATAVGNFILNVMSGATGTDNTTLLNKVDVAQDFTTKAANANTSWTAAVQAQSATEITATTSDPATVTAQKAATTAFIASAPGVEIPLTINVDNLTSGATNAAFVANLFTVPTTGALLQTLSPGDTLVATGTGASLVATLNGSTAAVNNVTMSGISRADFTTTAAGGVAVTGSATGITGLTTVNNTGSTGALTLGAVGNGLKTALSTINVNSPVLPATGTLMNAIVAASALSGSSDTLNVNLTGTVGSSTIINQIAVGTDGVAGTAGTPQNAYETINLSATGASFVNLSGAGSGGVLSTTTLNLSGAGAINVRGAAAGDFGKLTTIDATKSTGGVTITGAITATGLLAGNTALTSFKGGTGADSIDISGLTALQAQAFTAGNLDGGTGTARDTYILGAAAAQSTVALNATNFEIVGVAGATTGTYNIANLGAGIDTLALSSAATAANTLTLSNPGANFTFAASTNGNGANLVTTGGAGVADVFNFTISDAVGAGSNFGTQTYTAFETLNMTISTATAGGDGITLGAVTATPTAGGIVTMNLVDNDGGNAVATGAINIGLGTLNVSGSGTAGVTIGTLTAGNLNAANLNTGASATTAGLTMAATGATATVSITGSAGADSLVGSTAADNINGAAGNDTIAGLQTAASGGDGLADNDILTGGTGLDGFVLRGDIASGVAVATQIAASSVVQDMTLTTSTATTDFITLSATNANYAIANALAGGVGGGGAGLQIAAGAQGSITVQSVTNAGVNPILAAGNEIVKLTTGVVTAGITVQQAFNNAIGTATVTGATATSEYFFTMYDLTNSRMLIGIVDDTATSATTIQTGDTVTLIGSVAMSATDYANLGTNNFSAIGA